MMQQQRIAVVILLFFSLLFMLFFGVCGTAFQAELETKELPDVEKMEFFSRMRLERIEEPQEKKGFSCFDVNENGAIIIGTHNKGKDAVLVYDSSGVFVVGFAFLDNGSFGVQWSGENIVLYKVRSNLAVLLDMDGNCLDMRTIQETDKNTDYWNNRIFANKRTVGETAYYALRGSDIKKSSGFIKLGSYRKLVADMPQQQIVLYEATGVNGALLLAIGVPTIFALVVAIVAVRIWKKATEQDRR